MKPPFYFSLHKEKLSIFTPLSVKLPNTQMGFKQLFSYFLTPSLPAEYPLFALQILFQQGQLAQLFRNRYALRTNLGALTAPDTGRGAFFCFQRTQCIFHPCISGIAVLVADGKQRRNIQLFGAAFTAISAFGTGQKVLHASGYPLQKLQLRFCKRFFF